VTGGSGKRAVFRTESSGVGGSAQATAVRVQKLVTLDYRHHVAYFAPTPCAMSGN
jgi:hypothetical protein